MVLIQFFLPLHPLEVVLVAREEVKAVKAGAVVVVDMVDILERLDLVHLGKDTLAVLVVTE
jgi:hypothetical protein